MLTALIDYESGNLHSAHKAFERMARETDAGEVVVTTDADVIARADRLVLPGDGAFPACMSALNSKSGVLQAMSEAVIQRAVPFMGICVGMQLLATTGREYHNTQGLDWIGGEVVKIEADGLGQKVPHMGWNDLVLGGTDHPVLNGVSTGDHAYFVHSYQFKVNLAAERLAHVTYGSDVTAIVGARNIIGTQFHPEKSQSTGLKIISNFLSWSP